MTQSNKPISPLRQRMLQDMTMRKFKPSTQRNYLRSVELFTRFLGRSPDTADPEDLRNYQLYRVEQGASSSTINAHISALKFFFGTTLDRPSAMRKMRHIHQPRGLPEILSAEEVTCLLDAAGCLKYQAALSVAYGAGLRAGEVVHLKTTDIDSKLMMIRVDQGKGKRDRHAMLSPALLHMLRAWWLAIANSRLITCDDRGVTFKWKDYRNKGRARHKTMTLAVDEFIRRFLIHVLPRGFHRIRHFGLFANHVRSDNLQRLREMLAVVDQSEDGTGALDNTPSSNFVCRHCGASMVIVMTIPRLPMSRGPPS